MDRLTTHNPNQTLKPSDGARWGTQRSEAWWREFNAKAERLAAWLAFLDEVSAAVEAARPTMPVVRVEAVPPTLPAETLIDLARAGEPLRLLAVEDYGRAMAL